MAVTAFRATLCVLQTVVLILVFVASVSCMFVKFPAAIQKTFLMRKLSIKRRKVEERFHTSSIVQIYHMRLLRRLAPSLFLNSSSISAPMNMCIYVFISRHYRNILLWLALFSTFYGAAAICNIAKKLICCIFSHLFDVILGGIIVFWRDKKIKTVPGKKKRYDRKIWWYWTT